MDDDKEFILPFNLRDSNLEENINFTIYNFPSNETININSINLDENVNNNFYNSLKFIIQNEKEHQIKNKSDSIFLISKEAPPVLLMKEISAIFQRNNIYIWNKIKNILNNNLKNDIIKNIENQIINKGISKNKKWNIKIDKSKKLLGRKVINDETIRNHNKYSSDNIINKIKIILKKYLINFINNIINRIYTSQQRNSILKKLNLPKTKSSGLIKDVDYKSIANMKKKRANLILLNYSLKQFLSFELSGRYRAINQKKDQFLNYNQKIFEYLLKDNKYSAIFIFVLNNLKFEDFLDIFTYTKKLSDFPSFLLLNTYEKTTIENCFIKIETYLEKLLVENNHVYFICFLLLFYNYRRYFSLKIGRNPKKVEID